jgi:hypothetical protein
VIIALSFSRTVCATTDVVFVGVCGGGAYLQEAVWRYTFDEQNMVDGLSIQ